MNWVAAGIALLAAVLLAALAVGYILLGNAIEARWGTEWAVFYGVATPLGLIAAAVAGVVFK